MTIDIAVRVLLGKLWIAALLLLIQTSVAWASDVERKLEAVFIGRFASYIEWPAKPRDKFVITLLDDNPFGQLLDHLYQDKRIHNKSIELRYANRLEQVGETDVLFITLTSYSARLTAIRYAQKHGILTISEIKGFAESGGIIHSVSNHGNYTVFFFLFVYNSGFVFRHDIRNHFIYS